VKLIFLVMLSIGFLPVFGEPILKDPAFEVEKYVTGLNLPTSIEFVDEGILVLQRSDGVIYLIKEGVIQDTPVLDVNVSIIGGGHGLLGITTLDSTIYVYFTESDRDGGDAIANRIYKYDWDGSSLKNQTLVKELPTGLLHNGGTMVTGPDGIVYAVIGDTSRAGITQNYENTDLEDTGIILKVNFDEQVIRPSKSDNPIEHYYAIGIRNSFGLAIDPVTGNLWDTENGPHNFDEVNFVHPKFNSGSHRVMGPATETQLARLPDFGGFIYSDPEFSWEVPVAPTGLTFVDSPLFENYHDSLLVSSFILGIVYDFKLNEDRTGFIFEDSQFKDNIANREDSIDNILFGSGFGGISDIKVGPDGLIYVVSLSDGIIYRILPAKEYTPYSEMLTSDCSMDPQPRINWSGCNFEGINLMNADLRFSNLTETNFANSNLQNADLSHVILEKANLSYANLIDAKFIESNLQEVDLSYSDLTRADLSSANLNYADLQETNLLETNLSFTNLVETKFWNADLNFTTFDRAATEKADFKNAKFYKTVIPSCNGSNFWYKALKYVLTEVHHLNFPLFQPIEWIIPKLCGPSFNMEPLESREDIDFERVIDELLN